jgi:hypothetical protein
MNDADVQAPVDSSTTTVDASTAVPSTAPPPSDVSTPASSTDDSAKPEGPVRTPIDVVRSALKPTEPEKAPDALGPQTESVTPKADAALAALTPEEEAKLPFHKHPRWKEVLSQRDAALARSREFEEPARQFGLVQEFMSSNNLTPPEMADGFTVMALMRNDPTKAIPLLENYLDQLKMITGQKLPDDIAKQVENGAITEEAANELAASRLQIATAQAQNARVNADANNQADQRQRLEAATAVNAWEMQAKSADPDYEAKKPFIRDAIVAQTAGRALPSPAQAVQIAQRAHAEVTNRFKGFAPVRARPTPLTPRSGDAGPATMNTAPPKTALEAAKRGLALG